MLKLNRFICSLAAVSCMMTATSLAQNTNSADLRGIVEDPSGSAIVGATVKVLDVDKNVTRVFTTDKAGLYDTGSIVPDHYLVTVSAPGFETHVRGPIKLDVAVETLNIQLVVGKTEESVVVTEDLPLLDTEDGAQTTTMNIDTLRSLPQYAGSNGADWQGFVKLLPGASYSFSSGQATSINGNLPYQSMLADGATTTLPMSTNADVTSFESTAEVKVDANSFSAQYGIGGIIFNQITKSGGTKFHGSAYDYLQNDALNAKPYLFGSKNIPQSVQRYDNYGFTIGGPVMAPRVQLRDKMFFFFNMDRTHNYSTGNPSQFTVPTDAERAGDFTHGEPTLYDPTTQIVGTGNNPTLTRVSYISEFGSNKIPQAQMDRVALAVQKLFPEPNNTNTATNAKTGFTIPNNNFITLVPSWNPYNKFFGRLDYSPVASHRLTISETESDNPAYGFGFGKQYCPVGCGNKDVSRDNAQISDVWTKSDKLVNEARLGFTDQLNFYIPASQGHSYATALGIKWSLADVMPNFNISNYSGLAGTGVVHAIYKEYLFDPSDVVTLIAGRHVMHFGGELLINRADSTAWGNENAGTVGFTGNYTDAQLSSAKSDGFGYGYADFLLGQVQNWGAGNQPEYGARLKNPQAFFQDDIKLRPNLTVNLGIRWAGTTGWSEVKGNLATFDPLIYNPGKDPNGVTGHLGGMWYGFNQTNGRKGLQKSIYSTFMPRVGASWSPTPSWVVRGGVGLYNYTFSEDTYGGGMGNAFGASGGESDNSQGIYPVLLLKGDPTVNYQLVGGGTSISTNYVNAPSTPDALNNQTVYYNPYNTPVPQIWQYNLTIQRQIGNQMMAQVAYVGSHGFNLQFPYDMNQIPQAALSPLDQAPGTNATPYPLFKHINTSSNNAISNYNSLQLVFQRRLSHGFEMGVNYTWDKFLDDQDSAGWGGRAGSQVYQNAYCMKCNYGPSNFDVRHAFNATATYTLPFGKGQSFLNRNVLVDEVVGGWHLGTVYHYTGGAAFTPLVYGADNKSYENAGNLFPNLIGNPKAGGGTRNNWFNMAAYEVPAPGTFGNVHRNSVAGPGFGQLDMSFGKTFNLTEHSKFEIHADANNALNYTNFNGPSGNYAAIGPHNPVQTSQLTAQNGNSRKVQLVGRLTF